MTCILFFNFFWVVCNGNSDGEYLLVVGVMIQDQVYRYCRMCKEGVHVHFYSWFFLGVVNLEVL